MSQKKVMANVSYGNSLWFSVAFFPKENNKIFKKLVIEKIFLMIYMSSTKKKYMCVYAGK